MRALRTVYDPELDRLLARHPNAPADLLETLSHSADKATRRQVVRHASTPTDALLRLAPQFPRDFLSNPVVDWLLIEQPDLLQTLGRSMLRNLLKSATCPQSLMGWAARNGSPEQQLAVAMNPAATPEVLELLVGKGGQVAEAARAHTRYAGKAQPSKKTSKEFIKEVRKTLAAIDAANASYLWRMGLLGPAQWLDLNAESRARVLGLPYPLAQGKEPGTHLCRELAKASSTPAPILAVLSRHPGSPGMSLEVRRLVAQNPSTPPAILSLLARDSELAMREEVARNPSAPTPVLQTLAKDPAQAIRYEVARNPRTPTQILEALAKDSDRWVRQGAATNSNTPVPVLDVLSKDSDDWVRQVVAKNSSTPALVLEGLARSSSQAIRREVAKNSNTSADVLQELAQDSAEAIRVEVASNPSTSAQVLRALAKDLEEWVRQGAAKNPSAPVLVLEDLAKSSEESVRRAVATNLNAPVHILEALAKDTEESVRRALAMNPSAPAKALEALAKDSERWVREEVAGNPSTMPNLLEILARDSSKAVRSAATQSIRKSRAGPTSEMASAIPARYANAMDPHTPPELLTSLASSKNQIVRWLVAANPGTPEEVRRSLAYPLLLAFGFGGLPRLLRPAARDARQQVRLTMDAQHWWHKVKLLAAKYNYALPERIEREEVIKRFQQERGHLARQPRESLAAQIIGAGKRGLLHLDDRPDRWRRNRVDLALKLSLSSSDGQQPRLASGVPRLFALVHANAPEEALVKAHRSVDWLERMAVARNLKAPQRVLAVLRKDANRLVAQQAADTEALQSELQQWPALAIRMHDPWKSTLIGMATGMTEWDGVEGETADFLRRVWNHREALTPLLSEANAQAGSIERVVGEIALRFRDQNLVVALWSEPVWLRQFDVADFWLLMLPLESKDDAVLRRLKDVLEPGEWNRLWTHLAGLQTVEIRVRVARHPLCPDDVLRVLSSDESAEVRAALAENPNSGDRFGERPEPGLKETARRSWWLLADPLTPPKVLEDLVLSPAQEPLDWLARKAIAGNPNAPVNVLERLSKDTDASVRAEVAANPNSSQSVIDSLAANADFGIERALLKSPKAPPNLLVKLATDFWPETRRAVAAHALTPASVLEDLSKDSNAKVRAAAAGAAELPASALAALAVDRDKTVRLNIARRADLVPDLLQQLAKDNSVAVREAVASHPLSPPELVQQLLDSLARDSEPTVRAGVVHHPSVTEELLSVLANDDDREVRFAVAKRRYESELKRMAEGGPVLNFAAAIKEALIREQREGGTEVATPHPWSAEDILTGLYALQLVPRRPSARFMNQAVRSKDWLTRLAVALHPHATAAHLKLLGKDEVADVVAAVRSRETGSWID